MGGLLLFWGEDLADLLILKDRLDWHSNCKPPIVKNQCMVYKFQCDLCNTDYGGYTTHHLHQRIGEHKHFAIGRHLEDHGLSKSNLNYKQFSVLRKCRSKFDCLIFQMLFIKELKPGLNTQTDSFRAKLFT